MMYQIMGGSRTSIEILSLLKKLGISDIPLVAQTYDGANDMSGSISASVQTRTRGRNSVNWPNRAIVALNTVSREAWHTCNRK